MSVHNESNLIVHHTYNNRSSDIWVLYEQIANHRECLIAFIGDGKENLKVGVFLLECRF
jgi:hypothetical protein